MGIWIELGVFFVALAFGIWQLRDVKKAQAERRAREARERADPVAEDAQPR
ncbi:MAG: hypothetical protein MUF44_08365 [Hydrogenophaga sp.]|jgi:hypothetical protein|nr:hypothetical protein [Hydrogenophaga sp.]